MSVIEPTKTIRSQGLSAASGGTGVFAKASRRSGCNVGLNAAG
jgi:hypothetical protein